MSGVANFLFTTEVSDVRPQTTNTKSNRNGHTEMSSYMKLK
jgi:hypothetical protein